LLLLLLLALVVVLSFFGWLWAKHFKINFEKDPTQSRPARALHFFFKFSNFSAAMTK
jgi:hypothetical protein